MTPETQLTGGTIATVICIPLLLAILVAGFFLLRGWAAGEETRPLRGYETDERAAVAHWMRVWSWSAPVLIVVTLAATWWGMYPWKSEYHHWVPKSGTVARADSRLVSDGGKSMQTKYVVMFAGDDQQQYGVLDTRAAGVKTGDNLTITCVRTWQFSGTDGYDCNFVSLEHK